METIFITGRLIFIGAVLTLFLGIILWKRFKRKNWVIEEYAYNPVPNPEDYPLNLYMGWLPSVYFPTGPYYLLETFIKDEGLNATEITRKRVFEYTTWAEYQEFADKVREARKKRSERVEKKDFTVPPEAVQPLNEWITLEHRKWPLWAKLFFMFIAVLGVFIFARLIWAFLTFPP